MSPNATGLARAVGDLDAHKRRARNGREDAHRVRRERQRDVVFQVGDAAHALALARLHLERGDRGAGDPADDARVQAELLKRRLQALSRLLELLAGTGACRGRRVVAQHRDGRQLAALLFLHAGRGTDHRSGCGLSRFLEPAGCCVAVCGIAPATAAPAAAAPAAAAGLRKLGMGRS